MFIRRHSGKPQAETGQGNRVLSGRVYHKGHREYGESLERARSFDRVLGQMVKILY